MSAPKLFTSLNLKLNYFRSETEECADGGKTCEEEMIQLAEEKEKEEKEREEKEEEQEKEGEEEKMEEGEKKMEEEEKMETDLTAEELQKDNKEEEEKKDEEEVPSTAVEKKRPSSDVEGTEGPPAKKLCTEEGETSIVPCEVVPLLITISLIKQA